MTARLPRDTTPRCDDCGWVGKTTTAGLAEHALRLHSCEKHIKLEARLARGRTRRAAIDRNPQPCEHKVARHIHGTRATYVLDRCRCRACAKANSLHELRRVRQQAYGRWNGYVDAQPVREHIAHLRDQGIGLKRIAALSGVPHGSLWKLVYGKPKKDGTTLPSRRCTPETARRVLTLEASLDALGARRPIDGTGTCRRLQALVANGWSITKLGQRLGITNIHRTIHGLGGGHVYASTARDMRALYDELWNQAPPETTHREKISASRARNYAIQHGWLRPLVWDDETIDEPVVELKRRPLDDEPRGIDEVAVMRRCDGDTSVPLTSAERRAVVAALHGQGMNDKAIERRTGIHTRQVFRDRQSLELPASTEAASA